MTLKINYHVSAIKYGRYNKIAEKFKIRILPDGYDLIWTRKELIDAIKGGYEVNAVFKNNSQWKISDRLRIITINNNEFLRLDNKKIGQDNFNSLPEFEGL